MMGVHGIRSLLLFFLPLGVFLLGCEKEQLLDCVKGTGSIVKVERSPGWFHAIELQDHVNLRIVPDSVNKVEVRGGENLVGMVQTTVKNGRMTRTPAAGRVVTIRNLSLLPIPRTSTI